MGETQCLPAEVAKGLEAEPAMRLGRTELAQGAGALGVQACREMMCASEGIEESMGDGPALILTAGTRRLRRRQS
jgi:hypothetical protein